MDYTIISVISLILLFIGMLGTFLPVLPGLLLSLAGLLIYKYGTGSDLSVIYIVIFTLLTIISAVLNYIIPARTNQKYGGTRWGSVGSVIGTLLGLFFFPPFGFFFGMLAGVFVGELLHDQKDKQKALNSVKGAFIGFVYGTGFSFVIALAMFLVVLVDMFQHLAS